MYLYLWYALAPSKCVLVQVCMASSPARDTCAVRVTGDTSLSLSLSLSLCVCLSFGASMSCTHSVVWSRYTCLDNEGDHRFAGWGNSFANTTQKTTQILRRNLYTAMLRKQALYWLDLGSSGSFGRPDNASTLGITRSLSASVSVSLCLCLSVSPTLFLSGSLTL